MDWRDYAIFGVMILIAIAIVGSIVSAFFANTFLFCIFAVVTVGFIAIVYGLFKTASWYEER